MSSVFRELLRKVGSGAHTSKSLTREEAATATRMMLLQEATPAQIGAFMISHRIKRPTPEELAGMLDAYDQFGSKLPAVDDGQPTVVLGCPYDGRDRTAPLTLLTALILVAANCRVVMHGGERMPTKYGLPLIDIWQGLGVHWHNLSLEEIQQIFEETGMGFMFLPERFPQAQGLVAYRDEIGKRPPFATIELMWNPYEGEATVVAGFVHPPTEAMIREAFTLRGTPSRFITVKGLEGSCDLPRDRTAIIGLGQMGSDQNFQFERLLLHPRDYNLTPIDVPLESFNQLIAEIRAVLQGQPTELMQSTLWNGGFYLWQCGQCSSLEAGMEQTQELLIGGQVRQQLETLSQVVRPRVSY
ncbi:MAG: anthranilate phosphoribosyltransferase family protein [Leptolyngbyaceae cyanobacterium bins.59]|nr:anthranilate phosphoribosyltransferase family protein [Leptolyngbyaceae cyanobacterium bins.59]